MPRCRLRKKSWKNPGLIYLDDKRFEKDIPVSTSWEMFLEVLSGIELSVSFFKTFCVLKSNNLKRTIILKQL